METKLCKNVKVALTKNVTSWMSCMFSLNLCKRLFGFKFWKLCWKLKSTLIIDKSNQQVVLSALFHQFLAEREKNWSVFFATLLWHMKSLGNNSWTHNCKWQSSNAFLVVNVLGRMRLPCIGGQGALNKYWYPWSHFPKSLPFPSFYDHMRTSGQFCVGCPEFC